MNLFRSSRRIFSRSIATSFAAAGLLWPAAPSHAADSFWSSLGGGVWGNGLNWTDGLIPDGVEAVADFSTLDLQAAMTVTLGGSFTVGTLKFGDTGSLTPFNTTLGPGTPAGTLTLATTTGAPTINVASQITVISAKLAGTQGFALTGAGILRLTGTANALSGDIRLTGTELQFVAGSLGTSLIDFAASSQLTWQGNHTQDVSSQIKIEDGVTAVVATGAGSVTFATALQTGVAGTAAVTKSGTGALTIAAVNTYSGLTKINQGRIILAGLTDTVSHLPISNLLNPAGTITLGQTTNSGILQLGNAGGASNQTTTSLVTTGTGTANAVVGGHSSISTLTINNTAAVAFAGFVGGTGTNENNLGLTKTGTGNLTLSNGGNTFVGPVTLNQGTLTFVSGGLGRGNLIDFTGNSNLTWSGVNSQDLSARIKIEDGVIATFGIGANNITFATPFQLGPLGTGSLTKGDSGTLTLTAINTYTGATRINNGRVVLAGGDNRLLVSTALQFGNGANSGILQLGDASGVSNQTITNLGVTGNASSVANAIVGGNSAKSVLTINNSVNIPSGSSVIFGGAGANENNLAIVKTGAGSLALSKANTFAGNIDIQGGAIIVNNNSSLGVGPKTVTIRGVTDASSLQLSNSSGVVLANNINFVTSNDDAVAAAIVNNAGQNIIGGTITLADGGFGGGHTRILSNGGTLILNGGITAASTAASNRALILDGEADGVVNGLIQDNGTVHLSVTKEGNGTWSLNGASTYSGDTLVEGGRLNLSTVHMGTGAVVIGNGATLGVTLAGLGQSLTPSSLTLNHEESGSALVFNLGAFANPTVPLITTGSFSTTGFGTNIIDVSGTRLSIGTIDLISYTGAIGGAGFDGLSLGTLPARVTANLMDGTGKVQLSITAFDVPKWTGAIDGLWDVNDDPDPTVGSGTVNWREANSGLETRYLQIGSTVDSVIFDDTATGTTTIELTTSLAPTTVTVNNSARTYTFGGSGKLTGETSLLKTGDGLLLLVNTGGNDYSGATTINGGTIQVGDGVTPDAGEIGTGTIFIGVNGTLAFDRPSGFGQDIPLLNVLSGLGTFVQQGDNTLTLSGNSNTFDGAIRVLSGTLKVGSANALGSLLGKTSVAAGAFLDVTGFSLSESIDLNGGTIIVSAGSSTLSGLITLAGGGTIDNAAGTVTINTVITGAGGLKKSNTGVLQLTAANTFGGGLSVNGGSVVLAVNQAYTGGTIVGDGGILQLGAGAASTVGNVGAGDIALNATTGVATLNILRSDAFEIPSNITSSGVNATNLITIGATGAGSASGTVTFSGTNTFTGNITINGGALRITNSGALGIGPKVIRIASNAGPALKLDGALGNIILPVGVDFAISSDGTIASAAANAGSIVNIAGDNVINGRISQINGGGGNGRLTVLGGTLTVNGNIDAEGATGARAILLGGTATGVVNGVVSDINSAVVTSVGVTKDGTGTWTLNGTNTFTGALSVQNGTLKFASVAANGIAQPLGVAVSAITLGTATTAGTLEYTANADATLARPITVNGVGGGILRNSGSGLLTLSGTLTRAARPLTFTGGAFNVTGLITGTAANLTIDGANVTLSQAANNYAGPTIVSGGGVLKNGAAGVLPDTTTVILGSASGNTGGTYDLNGFDETVTGITTAGTGARVVTNNAISGVSTLTLTGTSVYAGVIKDGATAAVAVTKNTGGAFTAAGDNTYTGATKVDGGSFLVSGSLSGTASVVVNNGGSLGGSGSITTGNNGNVTVASGGSLVPGLNGTGTLTLALGGGQLDASAATSSAGWIHFELGTTSNRIVLTTGTLNFGTGFDLDDFAFTDAGVFGQGTYVLFESNSAITAEFGPNISGTVLGFAATLALADNGTDLVLHVVPEPAAVTSLLGVLTTLLGLQRFRRAPRRSPAGQISQYSAS